MTSARRRGNRQLLPEKCQNKEKKKVKGKKERMSHLSQGSHDSVYDFEKCETAAVKVGRNLLKVAEGSAAKARGRYSINSI